MVVKISRSNQVIAVMNGAPITTHCIDGITNYNAWVGTAVGKLTLSYFRIFELIFSSYGLISTQVAQLQVYHRHNSSMHL